MSFLHQKYINLVSSKLDGFKRKSPKLVNFRCLFCGDSENKKKKRGYIYQREGEFRFRCHNCSVDLPFEVFLKRVDETLWSQMKLEKYAQNAGPILTPEVIAVRNNLSRAYVAYHALQKITHLPPSHEAVKYLRGRQIPWTYLNSFRWVPNFQEWTNALAPDKFSPESMRYEHGRILIPFFTREGEFFAYQGRTLDDNGIRYISINLDDSHAMIFNLEKVDFSRMIYAFEGPLDATFISNSVAFSGANFSSLTKYIPSVKMVVCYDNEPRSIHLIDKNLRAIQQGFSVVVWPQGFKPKDINAMVEAGHSPDHIQSILFNNTYSGILAQAKLGFWGKVHATVSKSNRYAQG